MAISNDTLGILTVLCGVFGVGFVCASVVAAIFFLVLPSIITYCRHKVVLSREHFSDTISICIGTIAAGALLMVISLILYKKASNEERIYNAARNNYITAIKTKNSYEREYPEFKYITIQEYEDNIMTENSKELVFDLQKKLTDFATCFYNTPEEERGNIKPPSLTVQEAEYINSLLDDEIKVFEKNERLKDVKSIILKSTGHYCNEEMPDPSEDEDVLVHYVETDQYKVVHFAGDELYDSSGTYQGDVHDIDIWYDIGGQE